MKFDNDYSNVILKIRSKKNFCFSYLQLQSSFGPDERLTRSRELLIKPKEDVAVHLLFAPTRVASMLAKLEIKQSAVRPSQPGVKFTVSILLIFYLEYHLICSLVSLFIKSYYCRYLGGNFKSKYVRHAVMA